MLARLRRKMGGSSILNSYIPDASELGVPRVGEITLELLVPDFIARVSDASTTWGAPGAATIVDVKVMGSPAL